MLSWLGLDRYRVLDHLKIRTPHLLLRPFDLLGLRIFFKVIRRLGFVFVVHDQLDPPVLLVLAEDKVDVFVQLSRFDHLCPFLFLLGPLLEVPFPRLLAGLPLCLSLRLHPCPPLRLHPSPPLRLRLHDVALAYFLQPRVY